MNKSQLIETLKQRGFSKDILNAFSKVRREDFIPDSLKSQAYEDIALPLGQGQTISQPYTIAIMLSLLKLKPSQKVLEIGSGCGYVLALISEIIGDVEKVYGIEIIPFLAESSKDKLKDYKNIEIYNKNGNSGLKDKSPFDRILISAACEESPKPLFSQLKDKGIIVAPVGPSQTQSLVSFQKINNKLVLKEKIPGFIFVSFINK